MDLLQYVINVQTNSHLGNLQIRAETLSSVSKTETVHTVAVNGCLDVESGRLTDALGSTYNHVAFKKLSKAFY